ncbi:MAG: Xaa-Pro aminopeptidase [Vulcanimicrobiaceae bacterium]
MNIYERRRAAVAQAIGNGVAIISAARHATRNADAEYEYRQDSDFYYLTGFTEPEAVLVIAPARAQRDVLFLRPRDRAQEIWTGRRLGVESAPAELGIHAAFEIDKLDEQLPELLVGSPVLYYAVGNDEAFDRHVHTALRAARFRVRRGGTAPSSFVEPATVIHEMRVRKQPEELELIRRAAAITHVGHEAGMRATRPGMWEYAVEATIEFAYRRQGAQDVAYSSIVAGGDNALILHYNSNRAQLRDGDLVLVDSGAEFDLYACDVTRTWPVNAKFTPEQRAIYEIVLAAQRAGIEQVRPDRSFNAYHEAAVRVLATGLIELGLLHGSVDEVISTEKLAAFYPHRTGHWLGLDVHDAGRYKNADETYRNLEPGMIVTVEPGIYVQRDLDCDERFKGIGVRIEDDIACTAGEPENLTAAIPKEISEIEALVGSADLVATR